MRNAREASVLENLATGLFIGGEWRPPVSGATFPVDDPSTGEHLAVVADGDAVDARAALDAAADTQAAWGATPARMRSELLRRAYELLLAHADELALLMTLEMGRPLRDSQSEVTYGAEFFRWFSEEAVRIDGRVTREPAGRGDLLVQHRPVGPVLLLTPWNFPLAMATRKIGPAVAAGCTMVLKPAEATPLTAVALTALMEKAGLPPGVLNLVTTSRPATVSEPLLADARLRKLSFTGSTAVGRRLAALAAPNLQRVSLELGGNAPFLVFADADLDAALDGAVVAKMRNMGEACTSANRFLVHAPRVEEFTDRLAARLGAMRLGRGTEAGVDVGPLISEAARAKVAALVNDAVGRGATLRVGGHAVDGPGWFYEPTVLTDVRPASRLLREEIFGPVAPIVSFEDDDEAVALANDTEYGLVAYAYTSDLRRAMHLGRVLEAGMVGINTGLVSNPAAPFGGVKQSGIGREGSHEGIAEYLDVTYLNLAP